VIFDMDGVLVDGEPLHFEASRQLFAEEGKVHSLDEHKKWLGTKGDWNDMARAYGLRLPLEHYPRRYDELILSQYGTCTDPLPGAATLVAGLRRAGVPVGVASSSRRNWVETCLSGIGLIEDFDAVVTGSEVEHGKPAPDIYLLAAERLGKDPRACLAIEDAPAGIEAAHAAGMTCWAVRTEYTRGIDLPDPDAVFESLEEIAVAEIVGAAA
jgi:HAD superfamily hydrolase (TIGR01509 family)